MLFASSLLLIFSRNEEHMGRGGTDRSKVGNSKKRYYPINFWILVVKSMNFLKSLPQPFLRYGNPDRLFLGTLKIKFHILKVLMFLSDISVSVFNFRVAI